VNLAVWVSRLLGRALNPWGELVWAVLLERSLLDDLPEVIPKAGVTLRLALPADLDEITRVYSTDPWLYILEGPPMPGDHEKARDRYLDRLRRGELCFLAISREAIAHVNWICFTEGEALPDHPIRLRHGEIFTTDAFTPPVFRGKNLHAFVLRAMLAYARERGDRHAYTLARVDRTNAHKGLSRLGWRECGWVIYFLPRGRTKARFLWRQGNLEPLFRPAGSI
jgi:GNAT superfamily N-acetyltransferase